MKMQKFFGVLLLLMVISFGFSSCNDDGDEPTPEQIVVIPYLQLAKKNYDIDGKAQTISVTVRSNIDNLSWTYYKDGSWVSLAETRTADYSKVYQFNVEENRSGATRVELIIFRAGDFAETATIVQSPLNED